MTDEKLKQANELKAKITQVGGMIKYLDNFLDDKIKVAHITSTNNCTLTYPFKDKEEIIEVIEILKVKRQIEYDELIAKFGKL